MHQDNPLITFEREGPHITAWTRTSSSPVVSEDPKEDHGYDYLTAPLRQRGLEVTVEYGLSDYIVHAALPDGSSLIISPPQEPPSEEPGLPESWTAIRHRDTGPSVYEEIYDSEPGGPTPGTAAAFRVCSPPSTHAWTNSACRHAPSSNTPRSSASPTPCSTVRASSPLSHSTGSGTTGCPRP
ncbi:hypothetical protein ACF09L_03375 [Streptomyces sp. NPDC014779]|uniref:hypothetical protein n=1 Tax=Streptomyces sp. NPDC014779 TaxID=3364911 RepID=UPI0036F85CA2